MNVRRHRTTDLQIHALSTEFAWKYPETISKICKERRGLGESSTYRTSVRINKKLTSCFRNSVVFIGDLIDCERSSQLRIRSRRAGFAEIPVPSSASSGSHKRPLKVSLLDQITGSYRQACNKAKESDQGPTVISTRKGGTASAFKFTPWTSMEQSTDFKPYSASEVSVVHPVFDE